MSTRRCLRCCKGVPETASFCRRCGQALRPGAVPQARPQAGPQAGPIQSARPLRPPPLPRVVRRGGRSAGLTVLAGFLVVGAGVAFLGAPGTRPRAGCSLVATAADSRSNLAEQWAEDAMLAETLERLGAARQRLEAERRRSEARMSPPPHLPQPGYRPPPPAAAPPAAPLPVPEPSLDKPPAAATPRIERVVDGEARAGEWIVVRGRGLAGAGRVLFAAASDGRRRAVRVDARFEVRDDATLLARVPDLGPGGRAVAIVVVTPCGAAVTVPRDAASPAAWGAGAAAGDFFVIPGDTTFDARPGATLFVERGATVTTPADSAVFVRAGGGVDRATTDCFIIRETANPQPRDLSVTPVLDVPAIDACHVDALFRYAGR